MTTSLKDVSSAEMIRTLAELGCFEQECNVYGYAWQMPDGKCKYRLSDDELVIHRAFNLQVTEQNCLTPVQKWTTRAIIREENKEDLQLYFKVQLADQLRQDFNNVYFANLAKLQQVQADEQAVELLFAWQEELNGYFEEDTLALLAGAIRTAYITKHLPEAEYHQLQQWLKWARKQAGKKLQARDNFERTFYGVACREENGTYRFVCNADEKALYNQVKEMDMKGQVHTPMYQRTYWSNRSTDLPAMRRQFIADMQELMDENYLTRMETLRQMSSAIPQELWCECLAEVETNCSTVAVDGFHYWGNHWNIEK
jgi:hypothetical protein